VNVSRMAPLLVGAFLLAGEMSAQVVATTGPSGPRTGTATVISKSPVIDGKLDDDVWKAGTAFTDFVQRELREGEPVTERTRSDSSPTAKHSMSAPGSSIASRPASFLARRSATSR